MIKLSKLFNCFFRGLKIRMDLQSQYLVTIILYTTINTFTKFSLVILVFIVLINTLYFVVLIKNFVVF